MNNRILSVLQEELVSRGFETDGTAPNETMSLGASYLSEVNLVDLFETLVARREKVFKSGDVVGLEAAKRSFDDVALAIAAVKATFGKLMEL